MTADRPRPTMDDIFKVRLASDAQISPDGSAVAFGYAPIFKEKDHSRKSAIWLADDNGARQFTASLSCDRAPRWSPDGRQLAFISDRLKEGKYQLYLLDRVGGEARQVTDTRCEIRGPIWLPDGRLAALVTEAVPEDVEKRRQEGEDPFVADDNFQWTRLCMVDLSNGELTPISPPGMQVYEAAPSPDGRRWALVVSDDPRRDAWYHNRLVRLDGPEAQPVTLYRTAKLPEGVSAAPVWSPDGRFVAFIAGAWSDEGAVAGDVWLVESDGGSAYCLTPGIAASFGSVKWLNDGRLIGAGIRDGEGLLAIIGRDGSVSTLWQDLAALDAPFQARVSVAADGCTFAVVREDPYHGRNVWVGTVDGEMRQLTHLQPEMDAYDIGRVENIHWTARDGLRVQGLLLTPRGWNGERVPLVVWVHGGPTGAWLPTFLGSTGSTAQILSSLGYAILMPNPRGSVGLGRAYAEGNHQDLGGGDLQDILAGVDCVVEMGVADPLRVGIIGWSYGGYMTAWAITQTTRFKAAVVGAGIVNFDSHWGQNSIHNWQLVFFDGASPLEDPDAHRARSPWTYLSAVQTPTLILHGQNDTDVPVAQAHELYRGLRSLGVETQLVTYPREPHGLQERLHVRDMNGRVIEWFRKHLDP
ncbi:MAG: S9 family peptidase [Anaerolineae bacterium]